MSRKCLLDCSANGAKWADDVHYYKRWMGGSVKKDIRIPGFVTLHDYYQHEFRMRTNIEYGC